MQRAIHINLTNVQDTKLCGLARPAGISPEEYLSIVIGVALDALIDSAQRASVVGKTTEVGKDAC